MNGDFGYQAVMARRAEIVKRSVGLDYAEYATGALGFDYERLLVDTGYDIEETRRIQTATGVGGTPLVELGNITALVRATARAGKGARIFVKDEAQNPSGSFKDRRASLSVHEAKRRGFAGVAAATSADTSGGAEWVTIAEPRQVFDLLALQGGATALLGEGEIPADQNPTMWFQRTYFEEAIRSLGWEQNEVGMIWARVDSAEQVPEVMRRIDAMFANSEAETESETEKSFYQNFFGALEGVIAVFEDPSSPRAPARAAGAPPRS